VIDVKLEKFLDKVPIKITDENNKLIGYVRDVDWLYSVNDNLQKGVSPDEEAVKLRAIRKAVIEKGKVETKVTVIKSGVPNTNVDGETGTINNRLPNLGDNVNRRIAVLKNGEFVSDIPIEDVSNGHWFDKEKTKYLLECLSQYHKEWDEKRGVFRNKPLHDWSSHAADAFRYFAVASTREQSSESSLAIY